VKILQQARSFWFNIPLKRLKKVMVVMALTGSARKTANTLSDKKSGRIKIRGISRISFRRHARSRLIFACPSAIKLCWQLILPESRRQQEKISITAEIMYNYVVGTKIV
jgi:hypothetical protein